MKFLKQLNEEVVDFSTKREQRQQQKDAEGVEQLSKAIYSMKADINAAINTSIDELVASGRTEDQATLMVMTYLSDLVMGHDLS